MKPCQDVSAAGRRAGITEGTRSGLWSYFADAIAALRPQIVVIENVRGLLSAKAIRSSAVESYDAALGNGSDGPVLRAAGAVLGDLADLGYDAQWATVAASSVGAPHRRERVFIVAHPAGSGGTDWAQRGNTPRLDVGTVAGTSARDREWSTATRVSVMGRASGELAAVEEDLLPTPRASDGTKGGPNQRGSSGDLMLPSAVCHLLPTPCAQDGNGGGRFNSDGHQSTLPGTVRELLPTPKATDGQRQNCPAEHRRNTPSLVAVDYYLPTHSPDTHRRSSTSLCCTARRSGTNTSPRSVGGNP